MATIDDVFNILGAGAQDIKGQIRISYEELGTFYDPILLGYVAIQLIRDALAVTRGDVTAGITIRSLLAGVAADANHAADTIDGIADRLDTGDIHNRLQTIQDRLDALEPIAALIGTADDLSSAGDHTLFGILNTALRA